MQTEREAKAQDVWEMMGLFQELSIEDEKVDRKMYLALYLSAFGTTAGADKFFDMYGLDECVARIHDFLRSKNED